MRTVKTTVRWALALLFVAAGTNHFLHPAIYVEVMPPYLPWPLLLVQVSGIGEVVLGAGVMMERVRRVAGWGLIALLVAVSPANVDMAWHGFRTAPEWILWARLPLQGVLIAWVYWCCLARQHRLAASRADT